MIVVDASIAAAWFLEEVQSTFATDLLHREYNLIAPDVMVAEVGSALVRAFRRKLISSKEVSRGIDVIVTGLVTLHTTAPLLTDASMIACQRRCSIYDASYIELARRTGSTIVTDDARMAEIARALAVPAHRPTDGSLSDPI